MTSQGAVQRLTMLDEIARMVPGVGRSGPELAHEFICDIINHKVQAMEEFRSRLRDVSEDGLTATLLMSLRPPYRCFHSLDSNGHVDINLIHSITHNSILKGEAKLVDGRGYKWYLEGLIRLVEDYNSGRERIALMVGYCRQPKFLEKMEEHKKLIENNSVAGYRTSPTPAEAGLGDREGVFVTRHNASGLDIQVIHVWVNMHSPVITDKEPLKIKKPKPKGAKAKSTAKKGSSKACITTADTEGVLKPPSTPNGSEPEQQEAGA